jgi:hypothetical protein
VRLRDPFPIPLLTRDEIAEAIDERMRHLSTKQECVSMLEWLAARIDDRRLALKEELR